MNKEKLENIISDTNEKIADLQKLMELQAYHRQQMELKRAEVKARKKATARQIRHGQVLERVLPQTATMTDDELEYMLMIIDASITL